jgi:hypothetical protein
VRRSDDLVRRKSEVLTRLANGQQAARDHLLRLSLAALPSIGIDKAAGGADVLGCWKASLGLRHNDLIFDQSQHNVSAARIVPAHVVASC